MTTIVLPGDVAVPGAGLCWRQQLGELLTLYVDGREVGYTHHREDGKWEAHLIITYRWCGVFATHPPARRALELVAAWALPADAAARLAPSTAGRWVGAFSQEADAVVRQVRLLGCLEYRWV